MHLCALCVQDQVRSMQCCISVIATDPLADSVSAAVTAFDACATSLASLCPCVSRHCRLWAARGSMTGSMTGSKTGSMIDSTIGNMAGSMGRSNGHTPRRCAPLSSVLPPVLPSSRSDDCVSVLTPIGGAGIGVRITRGIWSRPESTVHSHRRARAKGPFSPS